MIYCIFVSFMWYVIKEEKDVFIDILLKIKFGIIFIDYNYVDCFL